MDGRPLGRRTLWVLSIYQFLSNNRSSLFTVYFVLFVVKRDGVSVAEGLTAFSVAYVCSSLVSPVAGRISDRLRRRRLLLLVGEAASLPFFVLIPVVPGFLLVSVFFLLAETILSFGSTALQAFVADISSAQERGGSYGFLSAVGSAGSVVGILAAGVVSELFGLDSIFYMVGFVMAGTIMLILLAVPEVEIPASPRRKPLREMKGLAVFSAATSVRTLGTGAVTAFFGTYAYILGASNFDVSLVGVAGLLTTALLGARLGRRVDSIGEIPGYIYGTIIVTVSLVVYFLAGVWFDLIPARIIYAMGFGLLSPAMLSWVTKIAPENRKAEYLGFFALINSTLWALGPIPGGIVEAAYGPAGLFVFAGAATMVSLGSVYALYSRSPRAPVRSSSPLPSASPPP
ncbi:MAG: MFS transporter [Nitrososphaerota archaeon]|nr:MFS transporter [Nitrososphaerota archaeon]